METTFQKILRSIGGAETVDDIHVACSRVCELLGFDYFHYGARIVVSLTKPQYIFISGYPKDWWEKYKGDNLLLSDPTVAYCSANILPITWEDLRKLPLPDGRWDLKTLDAASSHGLKLGLSVPIHTSLSESAIFSLASNQINTMQANKAELSMPYAHLFGAYLHESVRRVFRDKSIPLSHVKLTEREKQCLMWAAEGKTTWETSQILNISERTVIFHLQNVTKKLNVSNRSHAVARALCTGLISPS